MDPQVVADGLFYILQATSRDLRARHPDLFREVDRIKAQPGWTPFVTTDVLLPDHALIVECLWCGDNFITRKAKCAVCCSQQCAGALRKFQDKAPLPKRINGHLRAS